MTRPKVLDFVDSQPEKLTEIWQKNGNQQAGSLLVPDFESRQDSGPTTNQNTIAKKIWMFRKIVKKFLFLDPDIALEKFSVTLVMHLMRDWLNLNTYVQSWLSFSVDYFYPQNAPQA